MSVFWNGRRIGKPADPIGTERVRRDGNIYRKTKEGWVLVKKAEPVKTKKVVKRLRSRYR